MIKEWFFTKQALYHCLFWRQRFHELFAQAGLISVSQVARITGMGHGHPALIGLL
jgi:hypothetical protein